MKQSWKVDIGDRLLTSGLAYQIYFESIANRSGDPFDVDPKGDKKI